MNKDLVNFLCCPNCKNNISLSEIHKEKKDKVLYGSLYCNICKVSYKIVEGIPILLPFKSSNLKEAGFRDMVSKAVRDNNVEKLKSIYDRHHFRKLAHQQIRQRLSDSSSNKKPAVLDIGIGWGLKFKI